MVRAIKVLRIIKNERTPKNLSHQETTYLSPQNLEQIYQHEKVNDGLAGKKQTRTKDRIAGRRRSGK
jgi:hypothetical protein